MKNKILILLWFASLLPAAASAQDTTRYLDQWYMFHQYHEYTSLVDVAGKTISNSPPSLVGNLISKFSTTERDVAVYGIAVTAHALPEESNDWSPSFYLYQRVTKDDTTLYTITDSANLDGPRINRFFEYRYGNSGSESFVAPCTEFYFDYPHIVSMRDSFYLSHYWPGERVNRYEETHLIPPGDTAVDYSSLYYHYMGILSTYQEKWYNGIKRDSIRNLSFLVSDLHFRSGWGRFFPIIGLRCTAPRVSLVERVGGSATVSWRAAEAGQEYQLAYAPFGTEPDSATQVSTTDTVFILDSLEAGTRTSVWVRKACRYTTAGYDTLVWSDWSTALTFMALGVGEVDDGSVTVTACGLDVVVSGARDEVRVYDMAGRCVAVAPPHAASVTLPVPAPGVYMVRTGIGTARKVVVLR